jgi:hypothetical protein
LGKKAKTIATWVVLILLFFVSFTLMDLASTVRDLAGG